MGLEKGMVVMKNEIVGLIVESVAPVTKLRLRI